MKKITVIVIVLLFGLDSQSQQQSSFTFQPGIYRTFTEFSNNKPSLELSYPLESTEVPIGRKKNNDFVVMYSLGITKHESDKIKRILGFCDGKDFYINPNPDPYYIKDTHFYKLEFLGDHYLYFESQELFSPNDQNIRVKYVFDTYTGKIIRLNNNRMKKILEDNVPLSERFKKEGNYENYKMFLIEYMK